MKKLDRRVVRTKKALAEALVEISLEHGYDRASVRQITQRADVGYATFYRHYKSKDELLQEYMVAILREVKSAIQRDMSYYDASLIMFRTIAKYRDASLAGLSLDREHPAIKPIWDDARNMVNEYFTEQNKTYIPVEVSTNHFLNSIVEMIRWWLNEGQDYKAEQMATMQTELILNSMESAMKDQLADG